MSEDSCPTCARPDGGGHEPQCIARPLEDWHEDFGPKLWWTFPIQEEPYCGSPNDSDWPGYHTHWTDIPIPKEP